MKPITNLLLIPFVLVIAGCAMAPPRPVSTTIYQVGNNTPDAGIIRALYTPSGAFDGWLVRDWAVNDYNARLTQVGSKLTPPVKTGEGITPYLGFHKMTGEVYDRWAALCRGDLP